MLQEKAYWILGLIISCSFSTVVAQSTLEHTSASETQRTKLRLRTLPEPLDSTLNKADTLTISVQDHFFDDFSGGNKIPDTAKWILPLGESHYPLITQNLAKSPPSLGVLTFDGTNASGQAYDQNSLSNGVTDEIRSHFIDLSGFLPRDQLYLSFALQPQGNGNAPEATDYFRIYFYVDSLGTQQYVKVFELEGSAVQSFQQYLVPVSNRSYLHDDFQIVFQAEGSRNGYLDHWHLDYVQLGPERSSRDTVFNDLSLVGSSRALFDPYALLPWFVVNGNDEIFKGAEVSVHNFSSQTTSAELSQQLTIPGGTNQTQENSSSLTSFSTNVIELPAFEDALELSGPTTLNYDWVLLGTDEHPENNTRFQSISLDNIYAYDDGEADAIYGLSESRGFGSLFFNKGKEQQQLDAVEISFVPLLNFNPVSNQADYMEDQSFRLVVWNKPHPDSILYQQIGNLAVAYGDSLDHFQRYKLNKPVSLPDSFWLGIQQLSAQPIGVGMDLSFLSDAPTVYYDSSGVWTPSKIEGNLMIRAVVSQTGVAVKAQTQIYGDFKIFPNPIENEGILFIEYKGNDIDPIHWELVSMDGRAYSLGKGRNDGSLLTRLRLPQQITSGIYLIIGKDKKQKIIMKDRIILK